jgi:hypothetical protein
VDRGRLIGLVSIGDVVNMRIAEVETETTATREYAGYCQEEGYHPIRLPQSMPHTMAGLGTKRTNSMERCDAWPSRSRPADRAGPRALRKAALKGWQGRHPQRLLWVSC